MEDFKLDTFKTDSSTEILFIHHTCDLMFLLVKEVSLFLKLSVSVTGLLRPAPRPEPPEVLVSVLFCLWVTARELCLGRDSLRRDRDCPSFRLGLWRFIRLRLDLALRGKDTYCYGKAKIITDILYLFVYCQK